MPNCQKLIGKIIIMNGNIRLVTWRGSAETYGDGSLGEIYRQPTKYCPMCTDKIKGRMIRRLNAATLIEKIYQSFIRIPDESQFSDLEIIDYRRDLYLRRKKLPNHGKGIE